MARECPPERHGELARELQRDARYHTPFRRSSSRLPPISRSSPSWLAAEAEAEAKAAEEARLAAEAEAAAEAARPRALAPSRRSRPTWSCRRRCTCPSRAARAQARRPRPVRRRLGLVLARRNARRMSHLGCKGPPRLRPGPPRPWHSPPAARPVAARRQPSSRRRYLGCRGHTTISRSSSRRAGRVATSRGRRPPR